MKKLLGILVFLIFSVFLMAGSAMAYPYIEVEGYVNPYKAIWLDNEDGTTNLEGVEYIFTVTDSLLDAEMLALTLEFENDVFASVANIVFLPQFDDWTATTLSSNDSVYEITTAGTNIAKGQSLRFSVDLDILNDALSNPSPWQEGQIWSQSWFALDTLRGGDGGSTHPIPEPATMLLFGCGLIGLAVAGRKKFQ